jgi:hypothetical protein
MGLFERGLIKRSFITKRCFQVLMLEESRKQLIPSELFLKRLFYWFLPEMEAEYPKFMGWFRKKHQCQVSSKKDIERPILWNEMVRVLGNGNGNEEKNWERYREARSKQQNTNEPAIALASDDVSRFQELFHQSGIHPMIKISLWIFENTTPVTMLGYAPRH